MTTSQPSRTGTLGFAPPHRAHIASDIARLLATHGISTLTLSDMRLCVHRTLQSRQTDLPKLLREATDGFMLRGEGVELVLEGESLHWTADAALADHLQALTTASDNKHGI